MKQLSKCVKRNREALTKEVYMNATKKFRMLSSVFIVLGLLLGTSLNPAQAQGPGEENAAAQIVGQASSLSGWFSIIWGDSKDGESSMIYTLTDVNGQRTLLQLDETVARKLGGVLQFNGKYVSVQGTLATPSYTGTTSETQSPPAVLNVISISLAPSPGSQAPTINDVTALAVVSGSRPWVTIMCKFSDIAAEPNDLAYFLGMYGDTRPGLNHYWKELSFNTADVTGSTVGTGWYTLPQTELHYNPTDTPKGTNLSALANDCIAEADADVDFSLYSGINMMFNSDFDNGWAWGGGWNDTLDGVTRPWSITWEPPWAYSDISVIAHEMGHGFGLPHSSYNRAAVYDNAWDVMSWDRYNCAAATDATYGCMAQHTISYHKDLLGWIPGPQKTTVATGASATVTLEDLAAPISTNYQIVNIPIGGSATNFYTVEARRFTGYDAKLPDEAVIIHNVDTTQGIPAVLVPGGLSSTHPDVRWTVGETFTDATNNIAVIVNSATATGFEVTISNGSLAPFPPTGLQITGSNIGTAFNLTATWIANSEADMMEYRLYRTDGPRILIGATPHPNTFYGPFGVTVSDGSSGTLTFVLTAVDTDDYESGDSNPTLYSFNFIAPPSRPTNVSASDGTYTDRVEIRWSASLGATSYKVYRSRSNDPGATKVLLGTTTDTFFNDTTGVPKRTYHYWVKASNANRTSKLSAYDKGYRSDGSPLIPTNVSASDRTYVDRVEVTWSASLRAESYKVYRARSNDPGIKKTLLGTITETIFNDTTAIPMKKYFYWVKASNSIGTSKFSAYDKGYR
jgi:M6 family metalloprotease-like protein